MSEPRWRVGQKLGRTLYRNDRCVGMVDTPELAAEIVAAMNGAAPNDREAIATQLSREANRIFNKQARDYPSNVLDVLSNNIRAGDTENLTVPHEGFPKPAVIEEYDAGLLLRAATSFRFQGPSGMYGDYVMVDYDDEADAWFLHEHKPGRHFRDLKPVEFKTQAEALTEARKLTKGEP